MGSKRASLSLVKETEYGSVTVCGCFITEKPHMVRRMAITSFPPMADDRRGLLTEREREIISGEADVSDKYYYSVVSRVRRKIDNLDRDADLLREHHPDLYEELQEATVDNDGEGKNG